VVVREEDHGHGNEARWLDEDTRLARVRVRVRARVRARVSEGSMKRRACGE
jgi:hypothetical protein